MYTGNSYAARAIGSASAVYPCVYRELSEAKSKKNRNNGLSLCIQGTHMKHHFGSHHFRFIPVYTGNSSIYLNKYSDDSVYPCVYRELKNPAEEYDTITGLSLCIQGTQFPDHILYGEWRFIPVYTGNSRRCSIN